MPTRNRVHRNTGGGSTVVERGAAPIPLVAARHRPTEVARPHPDRAGRSVSGGGGLTLLPKLTNHTIDDSPRNVFDLPRIPKEEPGKKNKPQTNVHSSLSLCSLARRMCAGEPSTLIITVHSNECHHFVRFSHPSSWFIDLHAALQDSSVHGDARVF